MVYVGVVAVKKSKLSVIWNGFFKIGFWRMKKVEAHQYIFRGEKYNPSCGYIFLGV